MEGEKREIFLKLQFTDKLERELRSELKDGGCVSVCVCVCVCMCVCVLCTLYYQYV